MQSFSVVTAARAALLVLASWGQNNVSNSKLRYMRMCYKRFLFGFISGVLCVAQQRRSETLIIVTFLSLCVRNCFVGFGCFLILFMMLQAIPSLWSFRV